MARHNSITAISCPLPQTTGRHRDTVGFCQCGATLERAATNPSSFLKVSDINDISVQLIIPSTYKFLRLESLEWRRHSMINHGDISNSRPAKVLEILPVQMLNLAKSCKFSPNDCRFTCRTSQRLTSIGNQFISLAGKQISTNLKWPSLACYTFWKACNLAQPPNTNDFNHSSPQIWFKPCENYWFQPPAPWPSARLKTFLSVGLEDPFDRVTLRCQSVLSSSAFASRHEGPSGTGGLPFLVF